MIRITLTCAALATLLFFTLLPARGAGPADQALFDAPRGAWLATVRGNAALTVLEEIEGWRRVRIEGWVASTVPGSGTVEPAKPIASPEGGTMPAGKTFTGDALAVRGVLLPPPGDPSNKPGAGLLVLLVSDLQTLDSERARAGAECHAGVGAATEAIDRLKSEYDRALNSTDNLREAATRSDRLKSEIVAATKQRARLTEECRHKAEEIYQRFTVQKTISDNAGRFDFGGVPPGRYRVVATESAGDNPRAWSMECTVTGGGPLVLDPRKDASPVDPFWGLR